MPQGCVQQELMKYSSVGGSMILEKAFVMETYLKTKQSQSQIKWTISDNWAEKLTVTKLIYTTLSSLFLIEHAAFIP